MTFFGAAATAIARSPILWGCLASGAFFTLIDHDVLPGSELLRRYTTEEWVEGIETTFFFIGLAELLLKTFDLAEQSAVLRAGLLLGDLPSAPLPACHAKRSLDHLAAMLAAKRHGYLPRRLREALEMVLHKDSADSLADDLKFLADVDADRSHAGYAFLRIVIWSIPIWGFLGTVIGITAAIASLNPGAVESSLGNVTTSLGGVFDTTALALGLSIALVFGQFFVDRREVRLLAEVETRAATELIGRFERTQAGSVQAQLVAFDGLGEALLDRIERVLERRIETALERSLAKNIDVHAERLSTAVDTTAERHRSSWGQVHRALVDCSESLQSHGSVLLQVVEATGEVTKLEDALNRNLSTLAGARHVQETLENLSAAVHLLNARLGQALPPAPPVTLRSGSPWEAA
ncbi:MAG TPA: MotA/TolQ/ExbB proton channel family protein [Pirellulales bacterium]|nr:MotA/TolQ/ExbB proton channel family protein [Pirellulales bacterium]